MLRRSDLIPTHNRGRAMPDLLALTPMSELLTIKSLIALLTLAALEIVLGIDNVVFIAIITGRLPKEQQAKARQIGLLAAMGMRIILLFCVTWIMGLEAELFSLFGHGVSGKALILLAGGLFLIGKATYEIHHKLEEAPEDHAGAKVVTTMGAAITQVMIIDMVFSLDSVVTAVGMVDHIEIMIVAIVAAVGVMLVFAGPISSYIEQHPTLKMLALAFLILIGVMLVAEAFHTSIPRGYIYFAMGFSLGVEMLNIRARAVRQRRNAGNH